MKVQVNRILLNFEKTGQGEPLLLLHGNGENLHIFDKLTETLSQNFTVYAIDSRNHGRSSRTDKLSYEAMTEDIVEFIAKEKLGKVNIVGFSDGGIIALMLAMNYPELIDKMMLLGVNLKPSDFKEEIYAQLKTVYEQTGDPFVRLMLEEPSIELRALENINVPTYVVAAENDIFKPEVFVDITNTLPDARLKIMEGHSHESYLVGSDLLAPMIRDFLYA